MKSKLLDLDMLINNPDSTPQTLPKLNKIVVQINHNPAIKNKNALFTAIAASMNLTNQFPKINTANSSYASFNIRKGMQYSLVTTLRQQESITNFYLKFMFLVYPQYFIIADTSILSNVYPGSPLNQNFHIGVKIDPKVSANIIFHLKNSLTDTLSYSNISLSKDSSNLNKFFFSF
jgi:hypothetical protein